MIPAPFKGIRRGLQNGRMHPTPVNSSVVACRAVCSGTLTQCITGRSSVHTPMWEIGGWLMLLTGTTPSGVLAPGTPCSAECNVTVATVQRVFTNPPSTGNRGGVLAQSSPKSPFLRMMLHDLLTNLPGPDHKLLMESTLPNNHDSLMRVLFDEV
uniref:Uncharacterized protein n=1 Tax=Anopheles atroparvus TaxID=41427 RepID=A0A182IPJ3_ANOAO